MKRHLKRLTVGPGGRRCVCCFPAPGSAARKAEFRRAKRDDRRAALKVEEMNAEED